jgi:hypothetical protein
MIINTKDKVIKFTLEQVINTQMGGGSTALLFFNFGAKWGR